jgi:thiol-disulfide isomerase/thioredoxin
MKLKSFVIMRTACTGLLVIFSLSALAQSTTQNDQFILTGNIIGMQNGSIYLIYLNKKGKKVKDSCYILDERFHFIGKINEPTLALLICDKKVAGDNDPNFTDFFIEPDSIIATAEYNHLKEIKITGSKTQNEYEMLKRQYTVINKDSDSPYEKISQINYQFVITHPRSYLSAYLLSLYKSRWSLDSIRLLYNKLNPTIQKSLYGKEVKETIDKIENNLPGKMAKEFTTIDLNGNSVSLSNFKGRYVLLDFWATWCVPCRQSTPHIIELFKKYHNQGLDIIGIAEDDCKLPQNSAS